MKKTLIALAALATVSGAALAQSSVEIYGYLDVGVAKLKSGQMGVNNTNYVVPASQSATALTNSFARSGLTTNFMGFRGTEDLGGGMKATFNLQTGALDMSTGSPALAFSREANLGLSGGFGSIKIGRSVSTMCATGCSFDYNGIGAGSAYAMIGVSAANIKASSRRSNQIEYTAPTMVPGLTARLSYVNKGDAVEDSTFSTTLGSATRTDYKAAPTVGLNYAQGPVRVAFAYEGANSDDTAKRAAQFLGAEYDFGVAKVAVSRVVNDTIGGTTATTGKTSFHSAAGATSGKGWGASLAAPIGAATVGVQYGSNTENKTKATEMFARYSLSKRTELYSFYGQTSGTVAGTETALVTGTTAVTAPTVTNNLNALGLAAVPAKVGIWGAGVRHSF